MRADVGVFSKNNPFTFFPDPHIADSPVAFVFLHHFWRKNLLDNTRKGTGAAISCQQHKNTVVPKGIKVQEGKYSTDFNLSNVNILGDLTWFLLLCFLLIKNILPTGVASEYIVMCICAYNI